MKPIVLCDLDHTVSDAAWRDHMIPARDWNAYHNASVDDSPIEETSQLLRTLDAADWLIVGVTARPEKFRRLSLRWLLANAIPMHELLMRQDENYRPSPEMKLELVTARFGPAFADVITFMLEDRDDVAKAFKNAGVTVLQVHHKGSENGHRKRPLERIA